MDKAILILRGIRSNFSFLFHSLMKFPQAKSIALDEMLGFVASHLGLYCLPMSQK